MLDTSVAVSRKEAIYTTVYVLWGVMQAMSRVSHGLKASRQGTRSTLHSTSIQHHHICLVYGLLPIPRWSGRKKVRSFERATLWMDLIRVWLRKDKTIVTRFWVAVEARIVSRS